MLTVKKILSINKLRDKAQKVFNTYIRCRDRNSPCISCGIRSVEHASHYFNAGMYTALRFNEDNVHGSCIFCNLHQHGNLLHYRNGLINRIGEQRVLLLDSASRNRVKHWSRGELEIIIRIYKEKNNDRDRKII